MVKREVLLEKNVELKFMEVNILATVTRMIKKRGGIQTDKRF